MNLIDIVRKDAVSPFHIERMLLIDARNFAPVKKKIKADAAKRGETLTDDEIERAILSLKQYYAIALLDPLNKHAISDKLDVYWHAHMLFSEEYTEMCEKVVGGFMHHIPLDHEDITQLKLVGELYDYTQACYKKFFKYVDDEFNPSTLSDERLVCLHYDDTFHKPRYGRDVVSNALLPKQAFNFA